MWLSSLLKTIKATHQTLVLLGCSPKVKVKTKWYGLNKVNKGETKKLCLNYV